MNNDGRASQAYYFNMQHREALEFAGFPGCFPAYQPGDIIELHGKAVTVEKIKQIYFPLNSRPETLCRGRYYNEVTHTIEQIWWNYIGLKSERIIWRSL